MISIDKKYKTRYGHEVRIYATDGVGNCSIHGAYKDDGYWYLASWTKEGNISMCGREVDLGLVEVKEEKTLWVNIYPGIERPYIYYNRNAADIGATSDRIARVKVTYTEGQYDD